tara:strand:- start:357 stop:683 length:327 start_codon:yes stop_codon:yes gene_type:complete
MNFVLTNAPAIVQFVVTFTFFLFEAMLHYHIGKYGKIGIAIPKLTEFGLIFATIAFITLLSTMTTKFINNRFMNYYNKASKEVEETKKKVSKKDDKNTTDKDLPITAL